VIENKNIIVDQRPIWIVILDRLRRSILLAVIFIVFAILLNIDGPSDLSPEGYKVLCLFFLCVSLWSTNVIPLSATSLLVIAAAPLLGIMDASEVYSFFGNKGVFFILGAFILSGAMIGCGLSLRMTFWVIRHFGSSPKKLITAVYFFGAISSCFMSEHAVAAMMLPIVTEIVAALNLPQGRSVFAKAMFFSLAWGCTHPWVSRIHTIIVSFCIKPPGLRMVVINNCFPTRGNQHSTSFGYYQQEIQGTGRVKSSRDRDCRFNAHDSFRLVCLWRRIGCGKYCDFSKRNAFCIQSHNLENCRTPRQLVHNYSLWRSHLPWRGYV
jgi:di/tricarboxylate transporter